MADRPERLERDPSNKMIAGVASGVANYFGIDPTIVRVIWAVTIFFGGFGAVVYIIMWIVVPEPDESSPSANGEPEDEPDAAPAADPEAQEGDDTGPTPDVEGPDSAGETTEN